MLERTGMTGTLASDAAHPRFARLARRLARDRTARYWAMQLAGWSGLCVLSFISLTLWYNTVAPVYVLHTLLQAALGLVLTLPMGWAFRRVWRASAARRLTACALVVIAASLAWTALRIETFAAMTGETGLWSDFGGWFFASLLVMLSWALAYHGAKFFEAMTEARARAAGERVRRLTAEAQAKDAQLRMLRYQLNPHFLFNTLNSVAALVKTDRGEAACEMIGELSGFLRGVVRDDVPLTTSLGAEIDMLRLYLAIEAKRFGDRLRVDIDVPAKAASARVPSMILQPVVENSIKHAVARSAGPVTLRIAADASPDTIRVVVEDSGGARDGTDLTRGDMAHGTGTGLANVAARLEAQFGEDCALVSVPTARGWRTQVVVARTLAPVPV